jgi:hypothetical protein
MTRSMLWLAGILFVLLVAGSGSSNAGVAQSSAADSPDPAMIVTGIAVGRSSIAIVEWRGQSYLVGVGDRIGNTTVVAISGTEVVFKQNNRTFTRQVARAAPPSAPVGGGPSPATAPPGATEAPVTAKDNATPIAGASLAVPQAAGASGPAQPQLPRISIVSLGTPVYAPLTPAGVPDTMQSTVPLFEPPLPADTSTQAPPAIAPVVPSGVTGYSPLARPNEPTTTRSPVTSLAAPQPVGGSSPAQPPNAPTLPSGMPLYSPVGTPAAVQSTPPPSAPTAGVSGATQNPPAAPGSSPSQPAAGRSPQQPAIAPGPPAAPGAVVPPASSSTASSQATPSRGYVQLYLVKVGPISNRQRAQEIANRLIKAGFAARVSATAGTQYTITLNPSPQQGVGRSLAIIQSVQADVPIKIELSP